MSGVDRANRERRVEALIRARRRVEDNLTSGKNGTAAEQAIEDLRAYEALLLAPDVDKAKDFGISRRALGWGDPRSDPMGDIMRLIAKVRRGDGNGDE